MTWPEISRWMDEFSLWLEKQNSLISGSEQMRGWKSAVNVEWNVFLMDHFSCRLNKHRENEWNSSCRSGTNFPKKSVCWISVSVFSTFGHCLIWISKGKSWWMFCHSLDLFQIEMIVVLLIFYASMNRMYEKICYNNYETFHDIKTISSSWIRLTSH